MANEPSTTEVVPIERIDGSLVYLKDKSLRAVLEVSAINFELRSSDEQIGLLQQFQGFLNSVDFEMQIIIQSRKYDIEEYLRVIAESVAQIENEMLKVQADEYVRFVRELSDLANIMAKKFYVVIPIDVIAKQQKSKKGIVEELGGLFKKKKDKDAPAPSGATEEQTRAWRMQLTQRADLVASGLAGMGLKSTLLEEEALATLYSSLYNPVVPSPKEPDAQP